MKVILSGGGTGGHIYPALTIADAIKKQCPEAEIFFVGTQEGLEKNIIPRYGYELKYIEVAGFKRSLSLDTLRSFCKLFVGLGDAYKIVASSEPDLVIGTGGYVCGPICFMAALKGIPACIQEQNAMPGVTNKILARFVKKVFLGYEAGRKYFAGSSEKIYTGNPIRTEILEHEKNAALEELGLDPKKKTILVSGGSRGARSINKAMLEAELKLSGREDVQVLHATGDINYEDYIKEIKARGGVKENIIIKPYLHNMPVALAAADIAVFRAGAIGLAELMACGIPSVLIPYPYATANHQEYNARAVEASGAAKVILDKNMNGEKILAIIEELLQNEEELQKMQAAAKSLGKPEAAEIIAKSALALVKRS
ncbi:MAG: undecaprenyldiphospho-muramoylpentapeptide beta-N-acetylglucosaminyltransferase [Phascolarctobacterium sp.]|nr:undecaprenyldiphospho-muramoylpentapeptide beta-N-acetylglucosaminyltransferase [Phascolarctobacterium sp.]